MKKTSTKLLCLFLVLGFLFSSNHSWAQLIYTVAGPGSGGDAGDGGKAIEATLLRPMGVVVDDDGNMYLAEADAHRIRKVSKDGTITTYAGNGVAGAAGDNGPATSASLNSPHNIALDANGDLYIADYGNNSIRIVRKNDGVITTLISGLNSPYGIALHPSDGKIYFSEHTGHQIRRTDKTGTNTETVAGNGLIGWWDDETNPLDGQLNSPAGIAFAPDETLWVADLQNNAIRKIIVGSSITTEIDSNNGLVAPSGVSVDVKGNIYIADKGNNLIKLYKGGVLSILAGGGSNGDGSALQVKLDGPNSLFVDGDGNVFLTETGSNRVRKVEGFLQRRLVLDEGASVALTLSQLEFPATRQPDAEIVYTLKSDPFNGILFKDANSNEVPDAGEELVTAGTFTQADIKAGSIRFRHHDSETTSDSFQFTATYGANSDGTPKTLSQRMFYLGINPINDAPVIINNNSSASFVIEEDQVKVLNNLQFADKDAGNSMITIRLSSTKGSFNVQADIPGGVNAKSIINNNGRFVYLTSSKDALNATFLAGGVVYTPQPDYNGEDVIGVWVNDNGNTGAPGYMTATLNLNMTITPINDAPIITSNGGGQQVAISINEKTTAVTTVTATDVANEESTLTYTLAGGADKAQFTIDPASGALSFLAAPDFRVPKDADEDNRYEVIVRVTDNGYPEPVLYDEQSIEVTVLDVTPPAVVSIVRKSPAEALTNAATVVYTVTFDEWVKGIDVSDFNLIRTESASGKMASVSASAGRSVEVTVSSIAGSGTLRLDVKGSDTGLTDQANLDLLGGFTKGEVFTIDQDKPTVSVATPAIEPMSRFFTATFTFSEDVTGFEVADIEVVNATVSELTAINASFYTAKITPVVNGQVRLLVPADKVTDEAGNGNQASSPFALNYDVTRPSLTISAPEANPVNGDFTATFTFSEEINGFEAADIKSSNASVSELTIISPGVYTARIAPQANGPVNVSVDADQVHDAAGNGNEASAVLTRTYDGIRPSVGVASSAGNLVNEAFNVAITFSEEVSGFDATSIRTVNASIAAFSALSPTVYTARIAPQANGPVSVSVDADQVRDAAGNGSQASNTFNTEYDDTRPAVTIAASVQKPTNADPFPVSITFSEEVTGFELADIKVTGGTASELSGKGSHYVFYLRPEIAGPANFRLSIEVAADVAQDKAGNSNLAADAQVIEVAVACDETQEKVYMCHNGRVICVALQYVDYHLNHGDLIGTCPDSENPRAKPGNQESTVADLELITYPNPSRDKVNVEFNISKGGPYRVLIYDMKGSVIKEIASGQSESKRFHSYELNVQNYAPGVYVVQVVSGSQVETRRLIVEK